MKVTFTKESDRTYSVYVSREQKVDLRCGSIGYDDWLPHDLLHFVAEAEFGLDGGIFGDVAAGGNARVFIPVDPKETVKIWRRNRIKRVKLPDGRRSEQLAGELEQRWRERTLPPQLQQKLDALADRWHALQVGGSLTLEWPGPEGRKRHPARDRRRPAAARRR